MGSLENKGFDLELNAKILTGRFKWNAGAVWFKNNINVLDLGDMEEYPGAWTLSWDWRPFPIKAGFQVRVGLEQISKGETLAVQR